jgi:hypothetical protein
MGAVWMILAGLTLRVAYGWTGGWRPATPVAAFSRSIWTHLNLAFWPGLI